MYSLNYKHTFSAAHKLKSSYSKECHNFHGHNWNVRVKIKTDSLVYDMIIDFKRLKEIINQYDHKNLNEILKIEPTAENLARLLHNDIYNECKAMNKIRKIKVIVKVWEGEKSSVSYTI